MNFIELEDNSVLKLDKEISTSYKELPPGFYKLQSFESNGKIETSLTRYNPVFKSPFKTKNYTKINEYIDNFVNKKDILTSHNFKTHLGILFNGKPGSGKTTLVYQKARDLIKNQKACIFIPEDDMTSHYCWELITKLRNHQSNLFGIIYDECENYFKERESSVKQRLDGVNTLNSFITFACTNYVSQIPSSIANRKSRFRYVIKFDGIEDRGIISKLLLDTIPDYKNVDGFVDKFINSTLDDIKHGIVDILLGNEVEEPVERKIGFYSIDKSAKTRSNEYYGLLEEPPKLNKPLTKSKRW